MAATNNLIGYGTPAQVACTLTSLAAGSTRESAVVANTSSKDFDYLVALTFTIASGSPSTTGPYVNLWANGSVDNTLWPIIQLSSGAPKTTGAGDASIGALGTFNDLKLIGQFGLQTTTSASERTFRTQPFSVAAAFGGTLPEAFSILVENQTGIAFSASTTTSAQYLEQCGVFSSSGN